MSTQLERAIVLTPAWDRRDPDPTMNCGVHGVEIQMVLKGPKGAVLFTVFTNWHLPAVRDELDKMFLANPDLVGLRLRHPLPADVGYHSPSPMYEGQEPVSNDCPYVEGGTCYYDGSGLRAKDWFEQILLPKGSDGIWEALETAYEEEFNS